MSRSASYRYAMERQRRREIHLARVRETTRGFLEKHRAQHRELEQEFGEILPGEIQQLERDLARAETLLASDPEAARTLSVELGPRVYSLFQIGREARKRIEAEARTLLRKRQEEAAALSQQMAEMLSETLRQIADPIARDFALDEIVPLKSELAQSSTSTVAENQLRTWLDQIVVRAQMQAADWKRAQAAHGERESQLAQVAQLRETLQSDAQENPAELSRIIERLRTAEQTLQSGGEGASGEIGKQLRQIVEAADEAVSDERVRKEVVRGVSKALREAGFEVQSPERFQDGGHDIVQLVAHKPSGPQAEVKVHLSGAFTYHFDKYEGTACKKDINAFTSRLQDIYGVKLSEERVTWENPDRLTATSRPLPASDERHHG